MRIAVIGAGAAGLMFTALADSESDITVYEKMPKCGTKLGITGKGRCNVTCSLPPAEMLGSINHGKNFLKTALFSFTPEDTVAFFEKNGVPLKKERGNRVFPVSDKAGDVVACLEKKAFEKAKLVREKVQAIEKRGDIFFVITAKGVKVFDRVLIATGGLSYPRTGSTGDGYRFAESLGHKVTRISPALVPLVCEEKYCRDLMGLSLKNVRTSFFDANGKKLWSDFGEMLFTHFGVSGPMVLSASGVLPFGNRERYSLYIDLKPALDEKTLDQRILRDFEEVKNRDFANSLSKLVPSKLVPVIVSLSGIPADKKVNSITKKERADLLSVLKKFPLTVIGTRPIDEAIITSGGIDLTEIDPRTMESKITKGLFFAGEVIDADAMTGGFNLQIAFSTANLAAKNILKTKD